MAGPGTKGFGFESGWYPSPASPVGFRGVLTLGRKTGLNAAGWKLYANFFESIPFLLLLSPYFL